MSREAWAGAVIMLAALFGLAGVVTLAVTGALGAVLPAWAAAACTMAGGAIGWSLGTPRRP